jgi:uncharacterized protein YndB with AHSA1/START domain
MNDSRRDPAEGVLEQVDQQWQLRFVRRLPHPPEKVWRALTEEEHLAAWYPTTIEGERRAGAPLRLRFRGEAEAMEGRMIVWDPPRLLEFEEEPDGRFDQGTERVRFELAPEGDGCVFTLTTRYDAVGKSARDAAGWHICLDLLATHMAGEQVPAEPHRRWSSLNQTYIERFGPEAGTIGPPDGYEPA